MPHGNPSLKATPEELQRFLDMEPTKHFGDASTFSGAQAPEGKLPGTAPSRVLLQQLHDAGRCAPSILSCPTCQATPLGQDAVIPTVRITYHLA